jgi:hypothetical protein
MFRCQADKLLATRRAATQLSNLTTRGQHPPRRSANRRGGQNVKPNVTSGHTVSQLETQVEIVCS